MHFPDLLVLLRHRLERFLLAVFEHACACSLFNQAEHLGGLHIEDLGDFALHNEEVGVVDVELHGLKHVLNGLERGLVAVDEVLADAAHGDLARDGELGHVLKGHRGLGAVRVVEDDRDTGLGDAGLAALVDQVLEVARAHGRQVGDAEDEADGVQDIGLAAAVEPRDGVEAWVEAADVCADGVRLEPIDDQLLYTHRVKKKPVDAGGESIRTAKSVVKVPRE